MRNNIQQASIASPASVTITRNSPLQVLYLDFNYRTHIIRKKTPLVWLAPTLRSVAHTQRDVAPVLDFWTCLDNVLGTPVQSAVASVGPRSASSQASNPDVQPNLSSPVHHEENLPSVNITNPSVDHTECGRSRQIKPIVSNSPYSVGFLVAMSNPAPTHGKPVEHRRENRIVLEIEIRPRSVGTEIPWGCIRIPCTKSVRRSAALGEKKTLDFRLEVHGATTGTVCDALCERCTEKESRNSLLPPKLVDFTSKTDIIDLKNGKAQVTFRFLCLSTHHRNSDSEYR
jgi:hypothetical protein